MNPEKPIVPVKVRNNVDAALEAIASVDHFLEAGIIENAAAAKGSLAAFQHVGVTLVDYLARDVNKLLRSRDGIEAQTALDSLERGAEVLLVNLRKVRRNARAFKCGRFGHSGR